MPRRTAKPVRQTYEPDDVRIPWERYEKGTAPWNPPTAGTFGSYFVSNPLPMPDLLSAQELAGMCGLSLAGARRVIRDHVPEYAVVHLNQELRVHSWALAYILKMTANCPGCGRPWEQG